jgi:TATA element modulatory factor
LAKREADVRKKAREVNSKARRLEEDLEESNDRSGTLESEVSGLKTSLSKLQAQIDFATKEAQESRAELEREKKEFEASIQARIEEEKGKWRNELAHQNSGPVTPLETPNFLRTESPTTSFGYRKTSTSDLIGSVRRSHVGNRGHPTDLSSLNAPHSADHTRPSSKRSAPQTQHYFPTPVRTLTDPSLTSRQDPGALSPTHMNGGTPPLISASTAPSIHTIDVDDDPDDLTNRSSPQRTVAELISVSTVGAGPSVQLVERMSATVRRLEMEKSASREEISRLQGQRDEARDEVVKFMRELEGLKNEQERVGKLEMEIGELKQRYEAALEMLGERSEECEELKNDVIDLKKIYRELVESTLK